MSIEWVRLLSKIKPDQQVCCNGPRMRFPRSHFMHLTSFLVVVTLSTSSLQEKLWLWALKSHSRSSLLVGSCPLGLTTHLSSQEDSRATFFQSKHLSGLIRTPEMLSFEHCTSSDWERPATQSGLREGSSREILRGSRMQSKKHGFRHRAHLDLSPSSLNTTGEITQSL